ncbi:MAG: cobalamin-dependent protein [Actinomycetota bacterium]
MLFDLPLSDPALRPGAELLAEGRAMAADWTLGTCAFLEHEQVVSEAAYKREAAAAGRIMQHAHIGFRSIDRTVAAMAELHQAAAARDVRIDRFGITLDWSMGYPPEHRAKAGRGTGIVLTRPEDFGRITNASPAAAHFGDFMLGLPGAVHNTRAAIAAGATAIGNLGQYFTFRLPYWGDDVATTEATVTAIGLIAAQPAEILIHSNLDDGFAGLFLDMISAFGMMLIEKHIVEDLIGAHISFCFGHHFSAPLTRAAFHAALARVTETPGTMLFGNTVSYQGEAAANYASLANYLLADIGALLHHHSGHAINPVPVTENVRIPDVSEILDAQCFAARLVEHAPGHADLIDRTDIDAVAETLIVGGRAFADAVLAGLAERGVDIDDPAELLLAIRRLGAKRIEALWGQGRYEGDMPRRAPLVIADWAAELGEMAERWLESESVAGTDLERLRVVIAGTDVHEHGLHLLARVLEALNAVVIDLGPGVDAEVLVEQAAEADAEVIAISTYNGFALRYAEGVLAGLGAHDVDPLILMGGRLNQIPDGDGSDLPVDVSDDLARLGVVPCADLDDMLSAVRSRLGSIDEGS